MPVALIMAVALATMMLIAAVSDLRTRTVSNRLNLAIAALAVPYWFAVGLTPWPDMAWQVLLALLAFALFLAMYATGGMGAGDVKMIAAVALWCPWHLALMTGVLMSIAGGVVTVGALVWHRARRPRTAGAPAPIADETAESGDAAPVDGVEVPYAVAIAAAGLWMLHQQYLNHFQFNHIA